MNEILCFYHMALVVGFVSFDAYKAWLDNMFLSREEDILLSLESVTQDRNETIKTISSYLLDKPVDYTAVLKMIFQRIDKNEFSSELLHRLYDLWKLFPEDIAYENPFLALNYLEEIFEMGGKESTKEKFYAIMDTMGE